MLYTQATDRDPEIVILTRRKAVRTLANECKKGLALKVAREGSLDAEASEVKPVNHLKNWSEILDCLEIKNEASSR